MIGLDCHVIIAPDTRDAWVHECLESIGLAVSRAGFPVSVNVAPYVEGHIGQARAAGYAMGYHPYVTCVDDDDTVMPFAFAQMRSAMESGVSAVCTPELIDRNGWNRREKGRARHHLIAYRRDVLIDHTLWPARGDVVQIEAIGPDAIDLPTPAYMHRIYSESKARILRRRYPHELERRA